MMSDPKPGDLPANYQQQLQSSRPTTPETPPTGHDQTPGSTWFRRIMIAIVCAILVCTVVILVVIQPSHGSHQVSDQGMTAKQVEYTGHCDPLEENDQRYWMRYSAVPRDQVASTFEQFCDRPALWLQSNPTSGEQCQAITTFTGWVTTDSQLAKQYKRVANPCSFSEENPPVSKAQCLYANYLTDQNDLLPYGDQLFARLSDYPGQTCEPGTQPTTTVPPPSATSPPTSTAKPTTTTTSPTTTSRSPTPTPSVDATAGNGAGDG